jgi:hypothetical protein
LIERLLRPLLVVGALAALGGSYVAYTSQDLWAIAVYVGACAVLGVITVWRRLPWNVRAAGLLLLVYAVGVTDLIRVGKGGESRLFLLVLPFLATLFLGRQGGAIALALVGLTMVGFGWAFSARHIAVPLERQASSADPFSWLTNTVVLLLLGSLMAVSLDYVLDYVVPRVARALARSRSLTRDVVEHRDRLLQRASALKRRALQLEISAEVGRTITSILDTDHLLQKTVEMTRDRLGCYLVALFLLDESGERVDLAAAAGEAGVQVATKGLQLTVAETSLVGWTAKHRRPRLASNVRGDNLYRPDPLLPWTASEVTLPLIVGDQLLGVLDIQSRDSKAFEESDLDVLQGLADQVAVAIRNARMFHE